MGKKGKKGKEPEEKEEQQGEAWVRPEFQEEPELWITLELYLKDWKFMDRKMRVKTKTQIFSIKRQLAETHGRIRDLVLCKDAFEQKNELKDDMKTLEELLASGEQAVNANVNANVNVNANEYATANVNVYA